MIDFALLRETHPGWANKKPTPWWKWARAFGYAMPLCFAPLPEQPCLGWLKLTASQRRIPVPEYEAPPNHRRSVVCEVALKVRDFM